MANSLTKEQLKGIFSNNGIIQANYNLYDNYNVFVETGTNEGQTAFEMAKHFQTVHTIEIQPSIYESAIRKMKELNLNNVSIYLGDSSKLLPEIIKDIKVPIIFYLDGHWSQGNTGKGDKDVPLLEELTVIDNRIYHDVIIIDDFRLFGTTQWENWGDISFTNIHNCFKNKKIVNAFSVDDRYVICT